MTKVNSAELHFADDGLTYHAGQPFTGIAVEHLPSGEPSSEVEYREGLRSGIARGWYKNGQLAEEIHNLLGVAHGPWREWSKDGELLLEQQHEFGILVREQRRGDDGAMEETYRLAEDDPDFETLRQLRQQYGADQHG